MQNIEAKQDGNKLTITIDTAKAFGRSKSGKTTIVASTQGNVALGTAPDGTPIILGINAYMA